MYRLSNEEALRLFKEESPLTLGRMADSIRKERHPLGTVTFVVDRNINYTNVCINRCGFCAFYKDAGAEGAYVLTPTEVIEKVRETVDLDGTQILIQGGLNPDIELSYYTGLIRTVKERFDINIHGFSPPEITYMAKKANLSLKETIKRLVEAGLGSIPGGGAEILSDRIREAISPKKIKTSEWLFVMETAHSLGLRTTATMMFGCGEGVEDIIGHLDAIRSLQDRTGGFTAFIPWSFQPKNTAIGKDIVPATGVDYLKVLSISRIYLDNIDNIQASWVTQGLKMAQIATRFGANDFGSTMLEENVVRAAGVSNMAARDDIINAIKATGFKVAQRDTFYNVLRSF